MRIDRTAGIALLACGLGALHAPELSAQTTEAEQALRARIEQLERRLLQLEERLGGGASTPPAADVSTPAQTVTAPTPAAEAPEEPVRQRLEDIDQQVRILGRKQELAEESAAARAKEQPTVFAGKDGFGFRSADGAFRLRFGALVQADMRGYLTDDFPGAAPDNFLLRRVRPVLDATFNERFRLFLQPEFGNGGSMSLLDGYVEANLVPQFRIRAGKFKVPVGLERLQSPSDMSFVEFGFPTQLLPNRDVGFQVSGDVLDGRLSYAGGFFDGVRDGASADTDTNSSKDFNGRIFAHPFRRSDNDALRGLGFGVAMTSGAQGGTAAGGNLSAYVTPGQQTLFAYSTGTFAAGARHRWTPQMYWYAGPLGVLGEYVIVSQQVSRSTQHAELHHRAWQVYATWVLTGEDASYTRVTPRQNFDLQAGTWGAFEIGARVSGLRLDDDAFSGSSTTRFADPSVSARKATDVGLVLNWYLNRNIKLQANYDQTRFSGGASGGRDLPDEKILFTRMQAAF